MTISWRVQQQYFTSASPERAELIRLPPTILPPAPHVSPPAPPVNKLKKAAQTTRPKPRANLWTVEEHERFLLGLELFRNGPWKQVASVVGTKTTRQTMTHAQKYRQKIERRQRLAEAIENMAHAALPALPHFDPFVANASYGTTPPIEMTDSDTVFHVNCGADELVLQHGYESACDHTMRSTDSGEFIPEWTGELAFYLE